MKQTVEEAARENILFNHRTVDRTLSGKDLANFGEMNFIQGTAWQAKQSPWISVEEQPIPNNEDLVVLLEDGSYRIACSGGESGIQESNTYKPLFNVIAFIPIPTFDQILEANKDVLQRMKEKETEYG
mgnify:CR=1 FL=1